MMLSCKKEIVFKVDSNDIDNLISKTYGKKI